jgi:hypothetical protein
MPCDIRTNICLNQACRLSVAHNHKCIDHYLEDKLISIELEKQIHNWEKHMVKYRHKHLSYLDSNHIEQTSDIRQAKIDFKMSQVLYQFVLHYCWYTSYYKISF